MLLVKTKLDISRVHGIGLFSEEFIPEGSVIWQYHRRTCEVFNLNEFYKLCHELPLIGIKNFLNYSYIKNSKVYYISDNTRFINHSPVPNISLIDEFCEVAIRDIHPGEELLENYFSSYDARDFFCIEKLNSCETRDELLKILGDSCVNSQNIPEPILG